MLVKELKNIPHVISPLTLAENFAGKKRLTFDLRYINKHIYKQKVKLDGWKNFDSLNRDSKYV